MSRNSEISKLSQQTMVRLSNQKLRKTSLLKNKIVGKKKSTGRNNTGKITVRHKGGGVKRLYRNIKFKRTKTSAEIVCGIEYDPNRNAFIAALYNFSEKSFSYILAPQKLKIGDIVYSGQEVILSLGSSLPLSNIPLGTNVYNVSSHISKPATIARSAGAFAVIKEKVKNKVSLSLRSGEIKLISSDCFASIGEVSNESFFLRYDNKAGKSRWLNKRPTVRGVAMNPVDHPHGGGEGKKSGIAKTPWGKRPKKNKLKANTFKIKL